MSEQVECTTSLYLRADDSPDGALARLADVVRHVMREKGIPLRPAARSIAKCLGERWGVAWTKDDAFKRFPDPWKPCGANDLFINLNDSAGDELLSDDFDSQYRAWVKAQLQVGPMFTATVGDYGGSLVYDLEGLKPPRREEGGALCFSRSCWEGARPLPPVVWLHDVWGGLIEKDSELDQGPAAAWCIRASLAAELFGYDAAPAGPAESVPAQVLSLVINQSSPEDRRRKMAEACERIGQPVRQDDEKINWKSLATCRTFLAAVDDLTSAGHQLKGALAEIGERWGVTGSGLRKRVTECQRTLDASEGGRAIQAR